MRQACVGRIHVHRRASLHPLSQLTFQLQRTVAMVTVTVRFWDSQSLSVIQSNLSPSWFFLFLCEEKWKPSEFLSLDGSTQHVTNKTQPWISNSYCLNLCARHNTGEVYDPTFSHFSFKSWTYLRVALNQQASETVVLPNSRIVMCTLEHTKRAILTPKGNHLYTSRLFKIHSLYSKIQPYSKEFLIDGLWSRITTAREKRIKQQVCQTQNSSCLWFSRSLKRNMVFNSQSYPTRVQHKKTQTVRTVTIIFHDTEMQIIKRAYSLIWKHLYFWTIKTKFEP